MKTIKKSYQTWKWSLVAFAFSSLVGGDLSFAKVKSTHAQVLPLAEDNIVTVAGNGTACAPSTDPCGDAGPATAARLNNPRGLVASDSSGNLYLAEGGNHRIRKIDTAGIVTTVAGTGVAGFSGDGGLATAAMINNPYSVAIDSSGNLYISEFSGNRVRFVNLGTTPTAILGQTVQPGDITTIAGTGVAGFSGDDGPAIAAQLRIPRAVNFDSSGNLYIPDGNNHRIRVVNLGITATTILGRTVQAGHITTVVGNGAACAPSTGPCGDGGLASAAQLNGPHGIAFDSSGNIYIDDTNIHRIRKVFQDQNPTSLTFGEFIINTVAGTGVAGSTGDGGLATAAQINQPRGVAIDSSDNLFISESFGHLVRKVDTAGIITTVAGTAGAGFSGDGDPATAAQLNGPRGVNFDSSGNLYIADAANNRIRRLNVATPITIHPLDEEERWVKATIRFPADWEASEVNIDSVMLQAIDPTNGALRHLNNQVLQTARDPDAPVGPAHEGGPNKLWFKFDRETVASWSTCGEELALRVEGQFQNGKYLSGDTAIEINCP